MMHCILRVILTDDVQFSIPASGKILSRRPRRHKKSLQRAWSVSGSGRAADME